MERDENIFSQRLNQYMKDHRISIPMISNGTGISTQALYSYLRGAEPSIYRAKKIADFLVLSLDYMLGGDHVLRVEDDRIRRLIIKFSQLDHDELIKIYWAIEPVLDKCITQRALKLVENTATEFKRN